MHPVINKVEDVMLLFPANPHEIDKRSHAVMANIREIVNQITSLSDDQKTFANTFQAYDNAVGELGREAGILQALMNVSPDELLRAASRTNVIKLQEFAVEVLEQNKELYRALKAYAEKPGQLDKLTQEDRYYCTELLKGYKHNGLDLPDEQQNELKTLKKQLAELEQVFDLNINQDATQKFVSVLASDLAGLDPVFIKSLAQTPEGLYKLGVDYPTYSAVMENCVVESTRKALWQAYVSRAYPINENPLREVRALRQTLASRLGYASYAHYDIDEEMAKNPETVDAFLQDIEQRSRTKAQEEVERYKAHLPPGVSLTPQGDIKSWDWGFIKNTYRKKQFNFDDRIVAEYFPVDHTIQALLGIYERFLSISLKRVPATVPWHTDASVIEARRADGTLLGYLILDLFPRKDKYTHACHITLVPSLEEKGKHTPGASLVIANFPKPQADRPALLLHSDVTTFFHEFGHALHALLSATHLNGFAGTNVKRDFVEMPSQMLEEWMWDKDTIKQISKHYKTGKPLPDDLIDMLVKLKNFDSGDFVRRQLVLAKTSLEAFRSSEDMHALISELQAKIRPYMARMPEDHFECSFGHLTGYGSRYYGYLWSKVYALDLFEYIKAHGLLDQMVGKRYVETILSKGGSKPPAQLLRDFLGREPRSDAFFADLGF